jgi:hypothetical protein
MQNNDMSAADAVTASCLSVKHFTMQNNERSSAAVAAAVAADAGTPAQQWARDSNNALRSLSTGKCLDVPSWQFRQGAQMQVG